VAGVGSGVPFRGVSGDRRVGGVLRAPTAHLTVALGVDETMMGKVDPTSRGGFRSTRGPPWLLAAEVTFHVEHGRPTAPGRPESVDN
jgi:hypothetical protein